MTEKTTGSKMPFDKCIPPEAREHFRAARKEIHQSVEAFLPPEFAEHRHNARKEVLLAWRSMIDQTLQQMEKTTH